MICSICHENEAVLFLEQVSPSKRKLNLCVDCAKKYNVSSDSQTIGRAIASLFQSFLRKEKEEEKKLCPVCGISLSEVKRKESAGCPECYSIFKNYLDEQFKKIGVTSKYTGSMPKRLRGFSSVLTQRMSIQDKLDESLKNEDYERAAVYRDYLRALEKTPVSEGSDGE